MSEYLKATALGLAALATISATLWAAPVLEVDKTEWKMGKVPRNETRTNTFTLRNTGDEAVVITQIRPSCKSCLGKIDGDKTLLAGETRQLEVTYKAVDSFGEHSMSVTVHSNDPVRPLLRLRLSVEVVPQKNKPVLTVEPAAVDIGVVTPGQATTVDITLSNQGDAPLNVLSIIPSAGCQPTSDAKDAIAPGESAVVPVKVTARAKGVLRESIGFETNDPERPSVELQIEGYAQSRAAGGAKGLLIRPDVAAEAGKAGTYTISVVNSSAWTVTLVFEAPALEGSPATLEPGASLDRSVGVAEGPAPLVIRLELRPAPQGVDAHGAPGGAGPPR